MRPIRISVLIVGAVLFVSSSSSAAAPWQEREPSSALVQLWNQLTNLWNEIGCGADPHGLCRDISAPATRESGCIMDPGGTCRETAAPAGDIGCGIDPHG